MLDPVPELREDGRRHVGRRLGDEVDPDTLRPDQAGGALDLLEQRLRGVVEQQVGLVEEEAQLWLGQVARLRECVIQLREHPEHERAEEPGLVHDVRKLEDADDAGSIGRLAHEVGDIELGLAEEDVRTLLLEGHDRPHDHPERGCRDASVVGQGRLAVVARQERQRRPQVGQVEQRQLVVVAVLEDERQDRGLRLVEVEDLAEQQRAERMDGGPDLRAELA